MAKKQTQRELAIVYRINQSTISNLKKSGVDIYDRDEVRTAMLAQRKRPPAWVNGCPWDNKPVTQPPEEGDLPSLDMANLERLTREALHEGDTERAKLIEGVTKISKNLQQLAIFQRDYIPRQEVETDMVRISAGVRAGLNSLRLELPAVLEGFTAAQMKGKIDEKVKSIARLLADETSELYQQQDL